jgi:hypothetical protein
MSSINYFPYEELTNKYADAEQIPFFDFKLISRNIIAFDSIKEFNKKETGTSFSEPEEKMFGTHLKELKGTLKDLICK